MTLNPDPSPILYASISCGATILAEHVPATAAADDLSALAAACLTAAPRFHLLHTHAAAGRRYAFLIASPLIFFAIADDSLGRAGVLLFLRRLRDAGLDAARRRIAGEGPISERCLQEELVPMIRRLAAGSVEEKPSCSGSDAGELRRESEIPVGEEEEEDEGGVGMGGLGGRKSAERIWWRQVRVVLIIDVVVCSVLFGIWLSVCKGFQCIGG